MNVAIIGCGETGALHAAAAKRAGAKVVLCADTSLARAKALAATSRAKGLRYSPKVMANGDIDTVVVASPTEAHDEQVRLALREGKRVFCEGPLASTYAASARLVKNKTAAALFVHHSTKCNPAFQTLETQIASDAIGQVGFVKIVRRATAPKSAGNWRCDFEKGGGVIREAMVHDFEWIATVFGRPVRVYAQHVQRSSPTKLDYAMVTLTLETGTMAHIIGSWAHPEDAGVTVECCGEGGMLQSDSREASLQLSPRKGRTPNLVQCASVRSDVDRAWEEFMRGTSGIEGAATAVRITESAFRSAQIGQAVTLRWKEGA